MTLSLYISAIIIAKAINPNFITENLVLCSMGFAACSILQLFHIAMTMKRSIPPDYKPQEQITEKKKTTL